MLKIVKFKGCRRCGGDLFLERDSEDICISCLQCGAIYVARATSPMKKAESKKAAHARTRAAVR